MRLLAYLSCFWLPYVACNQGAHLYSCLKKSLILIFSYKYFYSLICPSSVWSTHCICHQWWLASSTTLSSWALGLWTQTIAPLKWRSKVHGNQCFLPNSLHYIVIYLLHCCISVIYIYYSYCISMYIYIYFVVYLALYYKIEIFKTWILV